MPRTMETAEIVRLYREEGLSSNAIAARAGVSGRTVLRRLQAAGVVMRPSRLPRALCPRCKKRPIKHPRARYCERCWPLHPAPAARTCELADCEIVFTPPRSKRAQRYCSAAHWYASPECAPPAPPKPRPPTLDELVSDGTFRPFRHEQLLEQETLDETGPEDLRTLQALFRAAASPAERRLLADCFQGLVRARADC
jgi:hypothetical protein